MKTIAFRIFSVGGLVLANLCFSQRAGAQVLGAGSNWVYTLTEGSQLIEDCPICNRLTIPVPMRGTFEMRYLGQNPLFTTYGVENISFTAGRSNGPSYKVSGQGVYVVGGELVAQQTLSLTVWIDNGTTNKLCYLTNALGLLPRLWPMLQTGVDQTNGTPLQQYHLDLSAAPFREIWFATAQLFQAGGWNPPTNTISAGDLLSSAGRVVRRNQQLTARLGIMPIVPDLDLKDVDILPGGEIAFSIAHGVFSERLGQLTTGDLLSDQGRIVRLNSELIAAFAPGPLPSSGAGLEAVQVMDSGETYFSVATGFFSGKLGRAIQTGDLLSDSGVVVRTGAELLAGFNPTNTTSDYGLRALYVWPSGEIWFATAKGFYDAQSTYYAAGDLLSDHGYVVYGNAELVSAFGGSGGAAGLGLNALFVVSDVTPVTGASKLGLPQLTNQPPASLAFQWSGGGRLFQLERAADAGGPYLPVSPIDPAGPFVDAGALTNQSQAFYRLHQW